MEKQFRHHHFEAHEKDKKPMLFCHRDLPSKIMGIGPHIKSVANPDMQVKLPKRRLRNNIFKSTTKLKDLKQFPALPKMFIRSERADQQADGHF